MAIIDGFFAMIEFEYKELYVIEYVCLLLWFSNQYIYIHCNLAVDEDVGLGHISFFWLQSSLSTLRTRLRHNILVRLRFIYSPLPEGVVQNLRSLSRYYVPFKLFRTDTVPFESLVSGSRLAADH